MTKKQKAELEQAERHYASMMLKYGENNMATMRAFQKWYELKKKYNG